MKRETTIAQVIGTFGGGGAQRLALNLADGLAERGFGSLAMAVRKAGDYVGEAHPGVVVRQLDCSRSLPSLIRGVNRLRRVVREHEVDVVHVHGSGTLPFARWALAGLRRRPRLLFTWHVPDRVLSGSGVRTRRMRRALRRCDWIFTASHDIARQLRERAPEIDPRLSVFQNGVPEVAPSTGVDSGPPVVVWAGRLVPSKDPQALLRAAASLAGEGLDFRVSLAGSAPSHVEWFGTETATLVGQLGLESRVRLEGWVKDVVTLYREAAIGVQTSHAEGLSMTLLEQMMAGLAIVATDVGDTRLAIRDGETGLLIPPGDDGALRDALRRLVVDRELRVRLGAAARDLAMREFSTGAMVERAVREYRRILA